MMKKCKQSTAQKPFHRDRFAKGLQLPQWGFLSNREFPSW